MSIIAGMRVRAWKLALAVLAGAGLSQLGPYPGSGSTPQISVAPASVAPHSMRLADGMGGAR